MSERAEALEEAAGALHGQLVRRAGEEDGEASERIAALVARDGALLSEAERGNCAAASPNAPSGSGRWSRCSPIRPSTR